MVDILINAIVGYKDIAEMLIKGGGSELDLKDNHGKTALMLASCHCGRLTIIELF